MLHEQLSHVVREAADAAVGSESLLLALVALEVRVLVEQHLPTAAKAQCHAEGLEHPNSS